MLTFKRLLIFTTILLCTLSIAACSGPSNANAQAATALSSNSSTGTTNEIAKENIPSQASKQTSTTTKQTSNQANTSQKQNTQNGAQVSNTVNDSQQVSGQTTVSQNTQNNNKQSNNTQNTSKQKTQDSVQNTKDQVANNNKKQNLHQASNVSDSSSSNSDNSSNTNTYIKVAQVSINGQMTNILTTANGMTLYYDTNDSAMNATCTGGCAQTWPPFLAQGQIITSNGITSGQITTQATANGNQVEYNGHPLYTYVNDTSAGQVNGQGVNNVWYAASMVTVQAAHW
jgi:predicted lipoprotein with Yx(FWY)xxD motif